MLAVRVDQRHERGHVSLVRRSGPSGNSTAGAKPTSYRMENSRMRKTNRWSRAAVMTAVAAATALGVATPALAAPVTAQAGYLTLAENQNLSGQNWNYSDTNSNLGGPGDEASSVFNGSDRAWVLYDDTSFRDRRYCITPGQRINNLHSSSWNFGDKISSIARLGGTSCAGYPTF